MRIWLKTDSQWRGEAPAQPKIAMLAAFCLIPPRHRFVELTDKLGFAFEGRADEGFVDGPIGPNDKEHRKVADGKGPTGEVVCIEQRPVGGLLRPHQVSNHVGAVGLATDPQDQNRRLVPEAVRNLPRSETAHRINEPAWFRDADVVTNSD